MGSRDKLKSVLFVIVIAFAQFNEPAMGQERTAPLNQRAIDMIALESGPALYGVIVAEIPNRSLTFVMQRKRFQENHPEQYAEFERRETAAFQQEREVLLDRIDAWREATTNADRLTALLGSEQRRLSQPRRPEQRSPLVTFQFARRDLRRVHRQIRSRREIAIAAIQNNLSRIELRSAADLQQELRSHQIDIAAAISAWKTRFDRQRSHGDTTAQWAARQALFEYALDKELNFEGTQDIWWEQGSESVPVSELLTSLVRGNLGAALLDANVLGQSRREAKPKPQQSAIQIAESRKQRGFRVTWIDLGGSLLRKQAKVTTAFYARMPDGSWRVVWQQVSERDGRRADAANRERIQSDPRISRILSIASAMGIDDGSIEQSLDFGSAIRRALQDADEAFYEFRDRFTKRLDEPRWPLDLSQP